MLNLLKKHFMERKKSYEKEILRGSIKELMKVNHLRSISFANYDKWADQKTNYNVHTVNIDIENGYIRFYGYNINNKAKRGGLIEDVTLDMYKNSYNRALEILEHEKEIPSRVRRNILVNVYR